MRYNIIYDQLSDITINSDEKITDSLLNRQFKRLLQNDISISRDKNPTLWECSWMNDLDITSKGYMKGDMVWYNTQDISEFLDKNSSSIYLYMKNNINLQRYAVEYDRNNREIFELYKSVLKPFYRDGVYFQPIFDIGQISDHVQIFYSTVDYNRISPSEDQSGTHWKKYIKHEDDGTFEKLFESLDVFYNHILDYHMGKDVSASYESEISTLYLERDISNPNEEYLQKFKSPLYFKDMVGFDYIVRIGEEKTANVTYKKVNHVRYDYYEQLSVQNFYYVSDTKNCEEDVEVFKSKSISCLNYEQDVEPFVEKIKTDSDIIYGISFSLGETSLTQEGVPKTVDYDDYYKISSLMEKYNVSYKIIPKTSETSSDVYTPYYQERKLCSVVDDSSCPVEDGYVCDISSISSESFEETTSETKTTYLTTKMFRLWNSGYLEHSGTISLVGGSGTQIVSVSFDWQYCDGLSTAPTYNYSETNDSFYGIIDKFLDTGMKYDASGNLDPYRKYVVQITPLDVENYSNAMVNERYDQCEIVKMTDGGFQIQLDTDRITKFSYQAYGYTTD